MGEVKAAEAGSSSARARNYVSVAYRSATVGGRKRMDARDNPKEDERERRREQNVVETRKRRIGLIYIELYYWTSISFLSILEGRAILSQLVEFGSEISLESYGILRLIDVPYFALGIVIHIFLRDAHLAPGLLPKFYLGLLWTPVFSRVPWIEDFHDC